MDECENEGANRQYEHLLSRGDGPKWPALLTPPPPLQQQQGGAESRGNTRDVSAYVGLAGARETPRLLPASWELCGGGEGEVTLIKLAERGNGVRPPGST